MSAGEPFPGVPGAIYCEHCDGAGLITLHRIVQQQTPDGTRGGTFAALDVLPCARCWGDGYLAVSA